MTLWSSEIKELEILYTSIKGRFPVLEKELEQLIETKDANVIMLYSRRCLEVIITDLCECELNRPRKTEPLKGIIDKLLHEEKVPAHIITSMHGLNDLSTFGAHPKEFEPEQVRPVLIHLTTIIKWYLKYKDQKPEVTVREKDEEPVDEKPVGVFETVPVVKPKNKPVIIASGIFLIAVIVVFALDLFNIFHKDKFGDLKNPDGIEQIKYASITSSFASEISRKLDANTFIMGSIMEAGGKIRINAKLTDTETEEIYQTFSVEGNSEKDFLEMIDSLSDLIKNYLEIKTLEDDIAPDIKKGFTITSAEAYRYATQGFNSVINRDVPSAIQLYSKVLEIDTNYAFGAVILSMLYYSKGYYEQGMEIFKKTYDKRDKLPLTDQIWLNYWQARLDKEPLIALQYMKQIVALDPLSIWNLNFLGGLYYQLHQYENGIITFEKYIEIEEEFGSIRYIWPYLDLGELYHLTGNHKREQEIYEMALSFNPGEINTIRRLAICALSQGDDAKADDYLKIYKSFQKEINLYSDSRILKELGAIYEEAKIFETAEEYYRKAFDLESQNPDRMNSLAWFLINNDININEGLKLIDHALEIEPENSYFLDTKGWGLFKQGSDEQALVLIKKAWDQLPTYDHEQFSHIQEVEQAIANQNK
jgi:tetratricopeptide (TPR) repeat protein